MRKLTRDLFTAIDATNLFGRLDRGDRSRSRGLSAASRRKRHGSRLLVEALEERQLLASPYSPMNGDQLASALQDIDSRIKSHADPSNTVYQIDLSPVTYTFSKVDNDFYGPNALAPIEGNVVIKGNGATLTMASGTAMRFFYVSGGPVVSGALPAGNLKLEDLNLMGGVAQGGSSGEGGGGLGAGGAIFNQGTVDLESVTLALNSANGGNGGAQNYNETGGGGIGEDGTTGGDGGGFGPTSFSNFNGSPGGVAEDVGGGGGSGFLGYGGNGSSDELGAYGGGSPSVASLGLGGNGGQDYQSHANGGIGFQGGGGGGGDSDFAAGGGPGGAFGQGGHRGYNSGGGGGGGIGGGGGSSTPSSGGGGGNAGGGGGGGFGGGGGASAGEVAQTQAGSGGFGGGGGDGKVGGSGGFGGGSGASGAYGGGGGAGLGGAIFNMYGNVHAVDSTLAYNTARGGDSGYFASDGTFVAGAGNGGAGLGGAIFNFDGNVTLESDTLSFNTVIGGIGGNGIVRNPKPVAVNANGGAIYNLAYAAGLTPPVDQPFLSDQETTAATPSSLGVVRAGQTSLHMDNTILSDSMAQTPGVNSQSPVTDLVNDQRPQTTLTVSGAHNLVERPDNVLIPPGVVFTQGDPQLGNPFPGLSTSSGVPIVLPITSNTSAAFGAGDASLLPTGLATDERGQARVDLLRQQLDIGAYEFQTPAKPMDFVTGASGAPLGFSSTLTISVGSNGGIILNTDGVPHPYAPGAMSAVNVTTVAVGATINVLSTPANVPVQITANTTTTLNVIGESGGVTANLEAGVSNVTIGSGNLRGIAGGVNIVGGPGTGALVINDSSDTASPVATLQGVYLGPNAGNVRVQSLAGLSTGLVTYSATTVSATIALDSGTLNVVQTGSAGTTIADSGATVNLTGETGSVLVNATRSGLVQVGQGSLQSIPGTVAVVSTDATARFNINDAQDASRSGTLLVTPGFDEIEGLAPGQLLFTHGSVIPTIDLGSGTAFNVLGPNGLDGFGAVNIVGVGNNAVDINDTTGTGRPSSLPAGASAITSSVAYNLSAGSLDRIGSYSFIASGVTNVGANRASITYSGLKTLTLDGENQGSQYTVSGTSVQTAIATGSGADTVNVGGSSNTLHGISAPLTVGGYGADTLNVNAQADSGISDTLTTGAITPTAGSAAINFYAVPNVVVNAGAGTATAPVSVAVQAVAKGTTMTVKPGAHSNVSVADTTKTVNGILGNLNLVGTATDALLIDDRGNTGLPATLMPGATSITSGLTYTVTASSVIDDTSYSYSVPNGGAVGASRFTINDQGFGSLELDSSASLTATKAINVQSVAATTPDTIKPSGGTTKVGSTTNSLSGIKSPVTIAGQGTNNSLIVNAQGDSGYGYSISPTSVTATGGSSAINYTSMGTLLVNGGFGSATQRISTLILGTAAGTPTTVNVGDDMIIDVSGTNGLDQVQGALRVNGQANDSFNVDDKASSAPHTYTLSAAPSVAPTANLLTRTGSAPITYTGLSVLQMTNSTGANTFNIESIADNYLTRIYNNDGQDVVNLSPTAKNLNTIPGILDFEGEGAQTTSHTTLNIDDQNGPASQWYVQGGSLVRTPSGGAAVTQIYDGVMAGVVINGGNKGNVYQVAGTAGAPTTVNTGTGANSVQVIGTPATLSGQLTVVGQGTSNTLDYSKYVGAVTVDLPLGLATGLGKVSDIQNVVGSVGNDLLVGDANARSLKGGTGRNVIVAETANDMITGGAGDNLLIAGATLYDTNISALDTIIAAWDRTDLTFAARQTLLSSAAFTDPLNATTVKLDGAKKSITAGPGNNWTFGS